MDFALAPDVLDQIVPLLQGVALAASRATGLVLVTPAFNRLGLTGLLRTSVAVVIAVPMMLPVEQGLAALADYSGWLIMGLLVKELLIGVTVGLLFGIPFWAAEVAGELVDLQRGSTMAQLVDPAQSGETGISSTLLSVALITLFFLSGGFMLMVGGYYDSYRFWPATAFTPVVVAPALEGLLAVLDQVMRTGLLMVAPLVIALLIADLMLAFLARMAPNMHIFDLSLAVKNLIFAVIMVLYCVYLVPLMLYQLAEFRGTVELLKTLAGAEG
ncbi:type III secretion system export apparatus subunit SctT [Pseudomonas sp. No.117]